VRGVAISKPSGPHSHVQNATDTSSATCDTPAVLAYNAIEISLYGFLGVRGPHDIEAII
jgi:hypothetical protein